MQIADLPSDLYLQYIAMARRYGAVDYPAFVLSDCDHTLREILNTV